MPISNTTFDQRLARINSGQTVDVASLVGKKKKRRSFRDKCMNVPFFTGAGILVGLPGYAYATTSSDIRWVLAEIQSVIALVG